MDWSGVFGDDLVKFVDFVGRKKCEFGVEDFLVDYEYDLENLSSDDDFDFGIQDVINWFVSGLLINSCKFMQFFYMMESGWMVGINESYDDDGSLRSVKDVN